MGADGASEPLEPKQGGGGKEVDGAALGKVVDGEGVGKHSK